MRPRAASASVARPGCDEPFSARYSSCAATHSGTNRSAIGCPARTPSNVARTCSRSTKPCTRDCTPVSVRSSTAIAPTAVTPVASEPSRASTVRTPKFCARRGLTFTVPSSTPSSA